MEAKKNSFFLPFPIVYFQGKRYLEEFSNNMLGEIVLANGVILGVK